MFQCQIFFYKASMFKKTYISDTLAMHSMKG